MRGSKTAATTRPLVRLRRRYSSSTHSPTHPLTHSPTHPLTHSPTHPLTTHPLTTHHSLLIFTNVRLPDCPICFANIPAPTGGGNVRRLVRCTAARLAARTARGQPFLRSCGRPSTA